MMSGREITEDQWCRIEAIRIEVVGVRRQHKKLVTQEKVAEAMDVEVKTVRRVEKTKEPLKKAPGRLPNFYDYILGVRDVLASRVDNHILEHLKELAEKVEEIAAEVRPPSRPARQDLDGEDAIQHVAPRAQTTSRHRQWYWPTWVSLTPLLSQLASAFEASRGVALSKGTSRGLLDWLWNSVPSARVPSERTILASVLRRAAARAASKLTAGAEDLILDVLDVGDGLEEFALIEATGLVSREQTDSGPARFVAPRVVSWAVAVGLLDSNQQRLADRLPPSEEFPQWAGDRGEVLGDLIWMETRRGRIETATELWYPEIRRGHLDWWAKQLAVDLGSTTLALFAEAHRLDEERRGDRQRELRLSSDLVREIVKVDPTAARAWAESALSSPLVPVRLLALGVLKLAVDLRGAEWSLSRYRARVSEGLRLGPGLSRTEAELDEARESQLLWEVVEVAAAQFPDWVERRLADVERLGGTDSELPYRLIGLLRGDLGRAVWRRVKATWLDQATWRFRHHLAGNLTRFLDRAERVRVLGWLRDDVRDYEAAPEPEESFRRFWLGYRVSLFTLAKLDPEAAVEFHLRNAHRVDDRAPSFSWAFAAHPHLARRMAEHWISLLETERSKSAAGHLFSYVEFLPEDLLRDLVSLLDADLDQGDSKEKGALASRLIDVLIAGRCEAVIQALESRRSTPLAGHLADLAIETVPRGSGHRFGDAYRLMSAVGGVEYGRVINAELERGHRPEHKLMDAAYAEAGLDWNVARQVAIRSESFTRVGTALSLRHDYEGLVDWILEVGPGASWDAEIDPDRFTNSGALVARIRGARGSVPDEHCVAALGVVPVADSITELLSFEITPGPEELVRDDALRRLCVLSAAACTRLAPALRTEFRPFALMALWNAVKWGRLESRRAAAVALADELQGLQPWRLSRRPDGAESKRLAELDRAVEKACSESPLPTGGRAYRFPTSRSESKTLAELERAFWARRLLDDPDEGSVLRSIASLDSNRATELAVEVLENVEEIRGVADVLVQHDEGVAIRELVPRLPVWSDEDLFNVSTALDRATRRSDLAVALADMLESRFPEYRRAACIAAGWQTDELLAGAVQRAATADWFVAQVGVIALQRQRLAQRAIRLVVGIGPASLSGKKARVDALLELCDPQRMNSPDLASVWRRGGSPTIPLVLWRDVRTGMNRRRRFEN